MRRSSRARQLPRFGWAVAALVLCGVVLAACGGPSDTSTPPTSDGTAQGPASASPADASASPARQRPTPEPVVTGGVAAILARVVDGDTIHALVAGKDEKVRIIGLDSPEVAKPGTPVECYAREATREAKSLLPVGAHIRLQADPSQARRDRYGRLLAHVILPDGRLFAEIMIRRGFATYYVYDGVPPMYAARLSAAQERAMATQAGLWSPSTCDGHGHEPMPTP